MFSDRFDRFRRLEDFGAHALEKIAEAQIAIVGMGVLGCYAADLLVRLGIKNLRIIDRDVLQPSDLGHQILYDNADVQNNLPKVEAAGKKLSAINPSVQIEAAFIDLNPYNVIEYLEGMDLVLDGLDNLAARFLLNDATLELEIPWVSCSSAGASGMVIGIPAGGSPCFRCLVRESPTPGSTPSCDTIGIWTPAAHWAAGQAVWLAVHGLLNQWQDWGKLYTLDRFPADVHIVNVNQDPACPACVSGLREFLRGDKYPKTFFLCGREEVTILPTPERLWNLDDVLRKWNRPEKLETTPYFVRFKDDLHEILLFKDGRVLIRGVKSVDEAQRLWGRIFGQWI
jgi:molybdopterin/thiamine biosynthesis adenylyltransferase